MKIVLDTNILVSGLLNPFGPAGEILRIVASEGLNLCYGARVISEYAEVLKRPKFAFEAPLVEAPLEEIKASGELVVPKPLSKSLPDADDEVFLEVAVAGQARFLVTGNLKHYPINCRGRMMVVSPAEFLTIYGKETQRSVPEN